MSQEFVIGLDVDGVIADFVSDVLFYYKRGYNLRNTIYINPIYNGIYTEDDIVEWDIANIIGKEAFADIMFNMQEQQQCARFSKYDGAEELVDELRRIGRVVFVTAPCWEYKDWIIERTGWLRSNFNADYKDIVFVTDKTLFNGDILIDDSPKNLKAWDDMGKHSIQVLRPWNNSYRLGNEAKNFADVIRLTKTLKMLVK